MDDEWWAFIATVDRVALLQERPGSVGDRAMRAQHEARRIAFYSPPAADQGAAMAEVTQWNRQQARKINERRVLNDQLRAYAARKATQPTPHGVQ